MATIPIFNPVTPFLGQIPGGLRPSLMVRIRGRIHNYGRCSIDFVNSPGLGSGQDIIFHLGIRPTEGVIVRNHFHHRNWGLEERYGHCKVRNNETFEIVILAEFQHYKLAVNGHHLGVFRHRLPLALVQFISISGDVTVDHILLEQDSRSAQESMIFSQVIATPAMPNMPIPMQVHHRHQPPSYFSTPPHSTFTRIGGITIERRHRHRPANVIVVQQHQNSSNVYRF